MSTIKEQNTQNKAAATALRNQLSAQLSAEALDGDLIAVVVPVAFSTVVQQNPSSALTIEEIRALAAAGGFTLYEP